MTTLADATAAYRICARAEGKSPQTVSHVCDAVRYFADFLGEQAADIATVNSQSLREFILALQTKKAFSQHRYTPAQTRTLSPESVASYVRAMKQVCFLGWGYLPE